MCTLIIGIHLLNYNVLNTETPDVVGTLRHNHRYEKTIPSRKVNAQFIINITLVHHHPPVSTIRDCGPST